MRHERAYPILTCPAGSAPAGTGRGSWTQTEPGLRTAGVGTLSALARDGTSRNRAVWYWTATLPFPVRHGDPAAGRAGGHRTVVGFHAPGVVAAHPGTVSCVRFRYLAICTDS